MEFSILIRFCLLLAWQPLWLKWPEGGGLGKMEKSCRTRATRVDPELAASTLGPFAGANPGFDWSFMFFAKAEGTQGPHIQAGQLSLSPPAPKNKVVEEAVLFPSLSIPLSTSPKTNPSGAGEIFLF